MHACFIWGKYTIIILTIVQFPPSRFQRWRSMFFPFGRRMFPICSAHLYSISKFPAIVLISAGCVLRSSLYPHYSIMGIMYIGELTGIPCETPLFLIISLPSMALCFPDNMFLSCPLIIYFIWFIGVPFSYR